MQSPTPLPGSLVWLRQRRWRVERARVERHVVRLDVAHHDRRLTVLTPFDRPVPLTAQRRPVRARRQQGLARLSHLLGSGYTSAFLRSAIDAHFDPWPHQLEPALAVQGGQRRILIADEVGLGKTIQAGLAIAELARRIGSLHALVITPAGLRDQWTAELRNRFALDVWSAGSTAFEAASHMIESNTNPWRRPGVWLASIDYLKQPHVAGALPLDAWDIVVIDEAHIATGRSDRHEICDELGRRARHLLLLSATPHAGDEGRFNQLLKLGALPFARDTIEVFRRTRADVALPHGRVVRWRVLAPSPELARLLDALQSFERMLLRRARPARRDTALLLLSVYRKRALSTMAALELSLARRLEWIDTPARVDALEWRQPELGFDSGDDMEEHERAALGADVGVPAAEERTWLRRLLSLAAAARRRDAKAAYLVALASRTTEPMVVFTEFRHSLEYLQPMLARCRVVATLHGGQSSAARGRELSRFTSGDASVLIATDVGGQGLNLQARARWIVNLELPWSPARLEQRIGRVDRIGQPRRVHATLLTIAHGAEHPVLRSIARRALAARRSFGTSTLTDVAPPGHLAVAATLIEGAPLADTPLVARPIAPSCGWARRARALARVIARRRRLRARWRGGGDSCARPVRTRLAAVARTRLIALLAVPIVDRTGDVVERHLVALAAPAPPDGALRPAVIAALEARATSRVAARLVRLAPILASAMARRVEIERAIAVHLHALRRPEEAQLGLFSQREARVFAEARTSAALAAADASGRITFETERAEITLGHATLEWIGEGR